MWLAGSVLVAVVLFFVYLRLSRTYAATSDGADQALQGWDMLHGNWLLRGWTIADVTYYTTEVPEYAIIEAFRGLRADDVHIAGAATYTLLVLAAGLLARGRSKGREGLIRFAVAAGIMIAPQFGNATHLLLSQPDHLGTQLPLLLVFLVYAGNVLGRKRFFAAGGGIHHSQYIVLAPCPWPPARAAPGCCCP